MIRPLALVGPTACGKSEAALEISPRIDAEIVSCDSMLLYEGLDVGTAKPSSEDRARVPHHLIDVARPGDPFSVARYKQLAVGALSGISSRGKRALLVGGSGLYFRAVVDDLEFPATDVSTRSALETESLAGGRVLYDRLVDLDPEAARKIEPSNVRRTVRALEVAALTGRRFSSFAADWEAFPPSRVRAAGVSMSRTTLDQRIRLRVAAMLDGGLLEEVRGLVARGLRGWLTAGQAIGYSEMALHLDGSLSLDEAVAATIKRTRALARRQMAWFRRDPRIRWFEAGPAGAVSIADDLEEYLQDG